MPYSDRLDTSADPAVRRGIIILTVVFAALIGFFFWYNNRSVRSTDNAGTGEENPGFFSRIFNFSAADQAQAETADADGDGVGDEAEKKTGTDASKADTDGDGLTDREEISVYKTDPLKADSDNDGVSDGDEIKQRRDPLNSNPAAQWPPKPAL